MITIKKEITKSRFCFDIQWAELERPDYRDFVVLNFNHYRRVSLSLTNVTSFEGEIVE